MFSSFFRLQVRAFDKNKKSASPTSNTLVLRSLGAVYIIVFVFGGTKTTAGVNHYSQGIVAVYKQLQSSNTKRPIDGTGRPTDDRTSSPYRRHDE